MKKFYKKKHIATGIFILFILFGISAVIYSYASGVAGCTLKTHSTGCNCHSTTPNSNITVTLSGPDTVAAGSTTNYTFSVSTTGSFTRGGIDIAVSNGTLNIGTSSGIKMLSGEIVHNARFTGATTKTFTYTAPSTPGVITMYATGAAGTGTPPWNNAPNKTIVVTTATGIANNNTPVTYNLEQNYPNPFNPVTKINYSVAQKSNVKITVFDILGNSVYTLINHKHESGDYTVNFDGSKLSSGTYIYKIEAGNYTATKKMLMIK
jgi:hypothetical protein